LFFKYISNTIQIVIMEKRSTLPSRVLELAAFELSDNAETLDQNPKEQTKSYQYDCFEPAHFQEIVFQAITRCEEIIAQILSSTTHTYETILAPFNEINDAIALAGEFLSQSMLHPDQATRRAAQEAELMLCHYSIDIFYIRELRQKVKFFAASYEAKHLSRVNEHYLNILNNDFNFSGHNLSRSKQALLRKYDHDLLEHELTFDHNLINDNTTVELTEAEITDIPDSLKERLETCQQTGNYVMTMDYPTYFPFMRQVSSREGRRKVSKAFNNRAQANAALLGEIVAIRQEMAELMGKTCWADIAITNSIAKSTSEIYSHYDRIIGPLTIKAQEEVALMTGMLWRDGHKGPLRDYDIDYYENEIIKKQFGIDHKKVEEYFPLDVVMEGLFDITGELFNIRYRLVDVPVWHPDVTVYVIEDAETSEEIAMFYMDLFPRDGKFKHACALTLVPGREMPDHTYRKPRAAIIANYAPPFGDRPSLLTQDERAASQHHEFGHVMNVGLTTAKYVVMSGFNTEIDVAEIPSQAMEFWAWEPELIVKYSRHYKTGKPMPLSMAKRLVESNNVNVGLKTLINIRKGVYDLALHTNHGTQSVQKLWRDISKKIGVIPPQAGTFFPATFGHIASFSYAANYNGYERVMPICADIFERFREKGLTDPELGMEYRRKILERGYTQPGKDTIKDFLGKVDEQPYLRNLGITAIAHS
jgi:thimet oligopeptidase